MNFQSHLPIFFSVCYNMHHCIICVALYCCLLSVSISSCHQLSGLMEFCLFQVRKREMGFSCGWYWLFLHVMCAAHVSLNDQ